MSNKLTQYFPTIRSREEVLRDINFNSQLTAIFYSWSESQQTEFLDFCTGVRGVKILYDAFFKEIMNPEYTPLSYLRAAHRNFIIQNIKIHTCIPFIRSPIPV